MRLAAAQQTTGATIVDRWTTSLGARPKLTVGALSCIHSQASIATMIMNRTFCSNVHRIEDKRRAEYVLEPRVHTHTGKLSS